MKKTDRIQRFEIDSFLEAIYLRYGYDFRGYARASLHRRINQLLTLTEHTHVSEMIPKLLHDDSFFHQIFPELTVSHTEMFRTPSVFSLLREQVLPELAGQPQLNVWLAGCSTGEEAYSMAIFLAEEGLLSKTQIYATDISSHALKIAEKGVYPIDRMKSFDKNYQAASNKHSLSDYYHSKYDVVIMSPRLKQQISFFEHDLSQDKRFQAFHLIFCRNVLIYFDKGLQNNVLNLLGSSLEEKGFLVLGDKESMRFSDNANDYQIIDDALRLFQKKAA